MTGDRTILRGNTVIDVRAASDGSPHRDLDITVEGGRTVSIAPTSDDQPDRVAVVEAGGSAEGAEILTGALKATARDPSRARRQAHSRAHTSQEASTAAR